MLDGLPYICWRTKIHSGCKICFGSLKDVSEVPRKEFHQLASSLTPDAGGYTANYGSNTQVSC